MRFNRPYIAVDLEEAAIEERSHMHIHPLSFCGNAIVFHPTFPLQNIVSPNYRALTRPCWFVRKMSKQLVKGEGLLHRLLPPMDVNPYHLHDFSKLHLKII